MGNTAKGSTGSKRKPCSILSTSSKAFKISNKQRREKYNLRVKTATSEARRKLRTDRKREEEKYPELRETRLKKNIPTSLDRKRVWEDINIEGVRNGLNRWPVLPAELLEERLKGESEATGETEGKKRTKRTFEDQEEESDEKWLTKLGDDKDDEEEHSDDESESESEVELQYTKEMDMEKDGPERNAGDEREAADSKKGLSAEPRAEVKPAWTALMIPPKSFPRLLITTSRHSHMHEPAEELLTLFGPSATYVPRGHKKFSIKEICKWALDPPKKSLKEESEPYTHVIILNDHHKIPNKLTIINLPNGPSFHFSMTNFVPSSKIQSHGRATSHTPELILNNFITPLGKLTASLFQSLFPSQPEFQGRQVVTLHNQRDYIFFRRHRYVFRDKRGNEKEVGYGIDFGPGSANPTGKGVEGGDLGIKVGLQELGPQFCLKLRRVERGVKEGVEWEWKGGMEKNKKVFQL